MNKQELRDAIYDEFVIRYYQSQLCQSADCYNEDMGRLGLMDIENNTFELMEDLADACITVMHNNSVLKAKKQEHEINK